VKVEEVNRRAAAAMPRREQVTGYRGQEIKTGDGSRGTGVGRIKDLSA